MSALSMHPVGTPTIAHHHFVAVHDAMHRWSLSLHAAFTRTVDDDAPRVPRHYPERRSAFMESAAMQREMFRL
ncbi:hypothetical protein ACAG25_01440 [Mycobacterium sp. pV006]|uniref:hypothetical protein n=1 Tax=Mycobacterium sp. pV006 TaxID=3238983 RepID=UPI00351B1C28